MREASYPDPTTRNVVRARDSAVVFFNLPQLKKFKGNKGWGMLRT